MIRRIRNLLFILLILTYILFEELIWNTAVVPVIRYISAFHLYRRFLEYIRLRAGRMSVLFLFSVPFVIGEIVGILSGVLAANLYFTGAVLLYACKIPLIVVALAILQNGKEKLLSFGWFAVCYTWVMKQLDKLHNSVLYLQTLHIIGRIRERIAARSGRTRESIVRLYRHIRRSLR